MKTIVTFIGAVILGASAASAQSVTVTAPGPVARVSFADLNLHSPSGRTLLQRRIRGKAGRQVDVDQAVARGRVHRRPDHAHAARGRSPK